MRISDYEKCQHRLPGMPAISCDPGCALTSMEKPCDNPTYETCPRYEFVELNCPACDEAREGPVQMVRDTVDWMLICPECGLELSASANETTLLTMAVHLRDAGQAVSG